MTLVVDLLAALHQSPCELVPLGHDQVVVGEAEDQFTVDLLQHRVLGVVLDAAAGKALRRLPLVGGVEEVLLLLLGELAEDPIAVEHGGLTTESGCGLDAPQGHVPRRGPPELVALGVRDQRPAVLRVVDVVHVGLRLQVADHGAGGGRLEVTQLLEERHMVEAVRHVDDLNVSVISQQLTERVLQNAVGQRVVVDIRAGKDAVRHLRHGDFLWLIQSSQTGVSRSENSSLSPMAPQIQALNRRSSDCPHVATGTLCVYGVFRAGGATRGAISRRVGRRRHPTPSPESSTAAHVRREGDSRQEVSGRSVRFTSSDLPNRYRAPRWRAARPRDVPGRIRPAQEGRTDGRNARDQE
ncbi:hypothetical protein SBADM41S_04534 [Streptomyces badius]